MIKDVILFNKALTAQLSTRDNFVRCNKGGIVSFHEKFDLNRVELSRSVISSNSSCTPNEIMMACFKTGRYKLHLVLEGNLCPIYRAIWFKDIEFIENFDFPVMTVKFDRPSFVMNDFVPLIDLKAGQALPA